MIDQLLASYKSVIVLDGAIEQILPFVRKEVIWIAADGAGDRVEAHYVVGDGDSRKDQGEKKFIYRPNQNATDFEKCLGWAEEIGALPSLVIGISGGEIDHVLGNLQLLLKYARQQSLFFLDSFPGGMKIGIPLEKGSYQFKVGKKSKVSFIPFSCCQLSTS